MKVFDFAPQPTFIRPYCFIIDETIAIFDRKKKLNVSNEALMNDSMIEFFWLMEQKLGRRKSNNNNNNEKLNIKYNGTNQLWNREI